MPRAANTPVAVLILLAFLTASCSDDKVVAPRLDDLNGLTAERVDGADVARNDFPPGGGWFPMATGNQWRYRGHSFTEVISPLGNRDTVTNARFELVIDHLGGTANRSEFWEQWTETFANGGSSITLRPLRQTRNGLWRTISPGVEMQLLSYPLHPGTTWMLGDALGTRMTVEAEETLRTPAGNIPAWRIRMKRPFEGPHDVTYVWYGRAGYLQLVSHLESQLPDGSLVRSDHTHDLTSISIAGPGRFLADAGDRDVTPHGRASPVR